jgi:hypothetical protein
MRRYLELSLLLNLLLLVAVGWRSAHQAPMNRPPRSEVGEPAGKLSQRSARFRAAASQPATPWGAIEAADPQRFIANLRAIGCPEQTIRDIVALRICRACRDRLVELEAASARSWDYTRNLKSREWKERSQQQRELRNEMLYTLESSLGQSWREMSSSLLGWPQQGRDPTEFLDVEKRRQLRELDLRYERAKSALEDKGWTGELDAEGAARLRGLERQKQADLAAILSPQELEDYLYRRSPASSYVRKNLPEAKSESEFQAMVRVAQEFEMARDPASARQQIGLGNGDPDVAKADAEREAAFNQRLKEVLGETRIAEQQAQEQQRLAAEKKRQDAEDEQRARARFTETAASVGVAEADAQRLLDRLKELEPILKPRFEAMEKSLTGTEAEKRQQRDTFVKAEIGKIAVEIVGEKGTALVEKLAGEGR